MPYHPEIHDRQSIRLRGFDYSSASAFFLTICTQNQKCLFGDVVDGRMLLNDAGQMIERWYVESGKKFPEFQCDDFVCMPNHVHFILLNTGSADNTDATSMARMNLNGSINPNASIGLNAPSAGVDASWLGCVGRLAAFVQWLKTMTTNEYIRGVKNHGWTSFFGKLWHRNYWDHIVRDEGELNRIRNYIRKNPIQWALDRMNGEKSCRQGRSTMRELPADYGTEPWMI